MKTLEAARKEKLIKTAHRLLDEVEAELSFIITSVKNRQVKKAA